MKAKPLLPISARNSGSTIVATLAVLVLTSMIVGSALIEAGNRFRTSYQSSRWSQAAHAAEAGAELALMSAQKNSWIADGWSAAPGAPGAAPVTKTFILSTGVPATGPISAEVSVDKIAMSGMDWIRIQSKGIADLSGGAVAGIDSQDIQLRKLSLRVDRSTGASVGTTPRTIRTIEILAQPKSALPFKRAILMNKRFTMSGGWVDSFDSEDSTKSTAGLYDVAKRQSGGNVGLNDTEGATNVGSAFIYGDLKYSGTAPTGTANIQGTISTPFSDPVVPVLSPGDMANPTYWTTFNPTPTNITNTTTLTGGTQSSPARYKVSSVTVPGGKVLTMAPHALGAESYIEVWVTGDFTTSGSGYIQQEAGVHVTYHIEGNVTVSGSSFNNLSNRAANNIINVVTPAVGVNQAVTVSGSGTFIGAINAPGAAFTVSGSASMSGAVIGKTMNISGGANVHYDEALTRLGTGGGAGYQVSSFVEAVR